MPTKYSFPFLVTSALALAATTGCQAEVGDDEATPSTETAAGEDREEVGTISSAISGTNGGYLLKTTNGLCLDVEGGSTLRGARIVQWGCHNSSNQQWIPTHHSQGWVTLRNAHSGLCLEVPGSSYTSGEKLIQWDCHGGLNQVWSYGESGNRYRNANSGLYLDVPSNSAGWGVQLQQWPGNGGPAQAFHFHHACGSLGSGGVLYPGESMPSCDGRFRLVMQTDGNLVNYKGGTAIWATHKYGNNLATMQSDGNLVVYRQGGSAQWASNTYGRNGAWLAVQNDGNLVIYHGGRWVWQSGTGGR